MELESNPHKKGKTLGSEILKLLKINDDDDDE